MRARQVIEIAIVKILATPDPKFDTLPLPRPFQSLSSLSFRLISGLREGSNTLVSQRSHLEATRLSLPLWTWKAGQTHRSGYLNRTSSHE